MAILANNDLMKGSRGKFGDDLVFRTMRGKTFVSPPARKNEKKKQSEAQRNTRVNFQNATQWAQITLLDPEKKAYYQKRAKALKLPNAYTAAITDCMRKPKVKKTQHRDTIAYSVSKPGFSLANVQVIVDETTEALPQKVVTRQKKDRWLIHYTPHDNSSSAITIRITDNTRQEIQFQDLFSEPLQQKISTAMER